MMNRRQFLRGAGGAMLALPGLQSLARERSATPPSRMAVYYVPIGVIRRGFFPGEQGQDLEKFQGFDPNRRIPPSKFPVGRHEWQWTPTLEPLLPHASETLLVTGLDRTFQNGTDVHAQCASCFLSSAAPFEITASAWPLDRTLDHVVSDHIGTRTPFKTLEFSCNSHRDNRESIYFDNISWYGTGHVAPSMRDPRQVYRRLFRTEESEANRAITDLVLEDARGFRRGLGHEDAGKFEEYLDSIRAIELKLDRLEGLRSELSQLSLPEPVAAHLPRGEYIRAMGDLMVVALQTGLTHVATFMVGPERWDTPMLYESLFKKPVSHHMMSHKPKEYTDSLLKIDRFHVEQYAYLVGRLAEVKEVDGSSLLDHTLFTMGSGLGDGSTHQYEQLPIVVAGGRALGVRTGGHLHAAPGTPLANLWLAQAGRLGLELPRFADSTGVLDLG